MVNVPIEPILIKVNFAILNRFEIFFYWMHHINWTMPIVTWLVGSHIYFGFCQPTLAVLVWWLCCGLRATARYSPINGQYYPHIEISQLICIFFANQLTVFYIMETLIFNWLRHWIYNSMSMNLGQNVRINSEQYKRNCSRWWKACSQKIWKIHRKTPILESL